MRNINPYPIEAIQFEALNYTASPDNITRMESMPVQSFDTQKEAEDYALECAHKDKGQHYRVRRISTGEVKFTAFFSKA